jgi:Holliday junction resolvase
VVEIWDEKLQKPILLGNENIRGLNTWRKTLAKGGLEIDDKKTQYIRILPPFMFKKDEMEKKISREQKIISCSRLFRKRFAFGLNMIVHKPM